MVQLTPADRVEVAEEIDDLGVPAPPQVSGQSHALVVESFCCKSKCRWRLRRARGSVSTWLIRTCHDCDEPEYRTKHLIITAASRSGDPNWAPESEAGPPGRRTPKGLSQFSCQRKWDCPSCGGTEGDSPILWRPATKIGTVPRQTDRPQVAETPTRCSAGHFARAVSGYRQRACARHCAAAFRKTCSRLSNIIDIRNIYLG